MVIIRLYHTGAVIIVLPHTSRLFAMPRDEKTPGRICHEILRIYEKKNANKSTARQKSVCK